MKVFLVAGYIQNIEDLTRGKGFAAIYIANNAEEAYGGVSMEVTRQCPPSEHLGPQMLIQEVTNEEMADILKAVPDKLFRDEALRRSDEMLKLLANQATVAADKDAKTA